MTSAMDLVSSTLISNVLNVILIKKTGINMLRELQIGKGVPKAAWLRL